MEKEIGSIYAEGFLFFGNTNRLISHELKNILAIISETLGLIDELFELSETGTALEPGKLRSLSESILEEVERANAIIRNMNTFAHSLDEIIREVDINKTLTLVIELSQLDSAARKTQLQLVDSEPCVIRTSPMFLQNLIYRVLSYSLRGADSENGIRISSDSHDNGVKIIFAGISPNTMSEFPTKKEALLAEALSAEVSMDAAAGELYVILPHNMGKSHIQSLISD